MAINSRQGPTTQNLSRFLGRVSLFVILLIAAIGVLGGVVAESHKDNLVAGLSFGFSTSLFAFIVSTSLNSWIVDRIQKDMLKEILNHEVTEVLKAVQANAYKEIAAHFPRLMPEKYYPPSDKPIREFEEELEAALEASQSYSFRGVTARHVPIFIEQTKPANLHASVFLLHPEDTHQIALYAIDRFGEHDMSPEARNRLIEAVRFEMFYAIVGLYDIGHICPIYLKLHHGPVFYRTEFFDTKCFVAYYVGKPRTTYPVTYVYGNKTFYYEAFSRDIHHCRQLGTPEITFTAYTTEEELANFLNSLGCTRSIDELRDASRQFIAKYRDMKGD